MKRLVIVAIMAAFLLGTVGAAQAAKLEAKGDWQMGFNYVKDHSFDKDDKDDRFQAVNRFRTTFEFIANENLKGVVRFNTGDIRWGANAGDGVGNIEVGDTHQIWNLDRAYVDFMIPNTEVNVKAGLQPITLPGTLGSHILDANVWALTASTQFNDMVGLTAGWVRLGDFNENGVDSTGDGIVDSRNKDEVDMFMAIVPVTMDGMQFNPFVAYARAGKNAFNEDAVGIAYTNNNYTSSSILWAGLNFSVDMFDPIVIMGDFNYGSRSEYYDDGGTAVAGATEDGTNVGETAGWIAALAVEYKMDMFTPMIYGLYESGESRTSGGDNDKGKVMPGIGGGDLFAVSSFGFSGGQLRGNSSGLLGLAGEATGKWALGLKLKDISFVEKLTHEFTLAYFEGTNHGNSGADFTEDDSAFEVNFDSQYQVYENLAAIVELGYLNVDYDDNTVADDNAWKAAAGFRYQF